MLCPVSNLNFRYPRTDRLNVVVSPYHTGEVIVQNYNAMLTLGHLSSASDAVLFLENEHVRGSKGLHGLFNERHALGLSRRFLAVYVALSGVSQVNRICTKLLNVVRPTLGDLNTVLSSHIASFIVPASSVSPGSPSEGHANWGPTRPNLSYLVPSGAHHVPAQLHSGPLRSTGEDLMVV